MTDRELLELAAKAAGIDAKWQDEEAADFDAEYLGMRVANRGHLNEYWNPINDDGDALRLAVQLDLQIHPSGDEIWVSNPAASLAEDVVFETYRDDPYAATRRAIVRAAAEIGRSKNELPPQ